MAETVEGLGGEVNLGGRKIPIWVFAVAGIGALGLYIVTRKGGGGGGPSSGLASAQYDQAIATLSGQIQALQNATGAPAGTGQSAGALPVYQQLAAQTGLMAMPQPGGWVSSPSKEATVQTTYGPVGVQAVYAFGGGQPEYVISSWPQSLQNIAAQASGGVPPPEWFQNPTNIQRFLPGSTISDVWGQLQTAGAVPPK